MNAQSSIFDVIEQMKAEAHASRLNIARPSPPVFDGATFDPEKDEARLTGQLLRVYECLKDGQWWTLQRLKVTAGGSEAGCSARIRDLRKPRWGAHRIERRRVNESGLWEYRLK